MLDLQPALAEAVRVSGSDVPCADIAVLALPEGCKLRTAYDALRKTLTLAERRRYALRPLAAARLVAMRLRLRPALPEGDAWGVMKSPAGWHVAVRSNGAWFAVSARGLARLPARFVVRAWEIA